MRQLRDDSDTLPHDDPPVAVGPPWLVLARPGENGVDVVKRETFSGVAFRKIVASREQLPGSFAAVMDGDGRLACHSNGRLYSPIAETQHIRTDDEKAEVALARAELLFQRVSAPQRSSAALNIAAYRTAAKLVAVIGASFTAVVILARLLIG